MAEQEQGIYQLRAGEGKDLPVKCGANMYLVLVHIKTNFFTPKRLHVLLF